MKFFKLFKNFRNDEDGAVTVDWVVLTAAVVGLGAAALTMVRDQTSTLTGKISTYLNGASVNSTF
jgi:Flp pilus assembly pilin Flp